MKLKILFYLSLSLLLLPSLLALGDTFGTLQGSLIGGEAIYFNVYSQDTFLYDSFEVISKDNFYALTITIPYGFSQVKVIPVVDSINLSRDYVLHSGETLQIDIENSQNEESYSSILSSSSSFLFQPIENEKKFSELKKGNFKPYEKEISITPIPHVEESKEIFQRANSLSQIEYPKVILEHKSTWKFIDELFLKPIFFLIASILAVILIILILKRELRSKNL